MGRCWRQLGRCRLGRQTCTSILRRRGSGCLGGGPEQQQLPRAVPRPPQNGMTSHLMIALQMEGVQELARRAAVMQQCVSGRARGAQLLRCLGGVTCVSYAWQTKRGTECKGCSSEQLQRAMKGWRGPSGGGDRPTALWSQRCFRCSAAHSPWRRGTQWVRNKASNLEARCIKYHNDNPALLFPCAAGNALVCSVEFLLESAN